VYSGPNAASVGQPSAASTSNHHIFGLTPWAFTNASIRVAALAEQNQRDRQCLVLAPPSWRP
jgi:hypothetical protein